MWSAGGGMTFSQTNSSGSGEQTNDQTTQRLSVDNQQYIDKLLKQFGGNTTADLTDARKKAIEDSSGAITDIMNQFKDYALPEIMTKQQQSGGYGGSTTQLLANDANARAVSQGAALRLQTINQYENTALNRSQQALTGLSTSLQALLQAQEKTTAQSAYKTKAKSTTFGMHTEASGGM